ncbi:MAG: ArgR family transcriptional regulator [Actinomycetaceae bacterium]|nr:ArgR family transcriptional regulator [Actinomycetaceae bacterium]
MSELSDAAARTPSSKAGRHAAIATILATQPITSQTELRKALEDMGIVAAQATLSRDLLEIRATKIRDAQGRQIYALADPGQTLEWNEEGAEQKLQRWAQDLLVGAATSNNFVILRTPAGAANLLASAIDFARDETVLGSVAGDDTIFVACTSNDTATEFCDLLLAYAEGIKSEGDDEHTKKEGN